MSKTIEKAIKFATKKHSEANQFRKYTGEPYIAHPASVAKIVSSVPHTESMMAAAWLHDTVEDTSATLEEIEKEFGEEICSLVEMLTDISKPEDGNRAARKAIDRAHTAKATPSGQTIKLADLIHNSFSIIEHDHKFAKVYLAEKALLLNVLQDGDKTLLAQAQDIVNKNIQF